MRARYYSPSMERFISEDPLGTGGGINVHAYALENPVTFRDPEGTDPIIGVIVGGVFGAVYGGFTSVTQGGDGWTMARGVAIGAATGALGGVLDPTFGLATVVVTAGAIGAENDAVNQLITNAGTSNSFDWGSTIGAGVAGAIAGATGTGLGESFAATGASEIEAAMVNNAVASSIGTPLSILFPSYIE